MQSHKKELSLLAMDLEILHQKKVVQIFLANSEKFDWGLGMWDTTSLICLKMYHISFFLRYLCYNRV